MKTSLAQNAREEPKAKKDKSVEATESNGLHGDRLYQQKSSAQPIGCFCWWINDGEMRSERFLGVSEGQPGSISPHPSHISDASTLRAWLGPHKSEIRNQDRLVFTFTCGIGADFHDSDQIFDARLEPQRNHRTRLKGAEKLPGTWQLLVKVHSGKWCEMNKNHTHTERGEKTGKTLFYLSYKL